MVRLAGYLVVRLAGYVWLGRVFRQYDSSGGTTSPFRPVLCIRSGLIHKSSKTHTPCPGGT